MNREIKFRGKRLNGQWAYGLLCHDPEKGKAYDSEWFISNKAGKPYAFAIAPSTIGQYTGLKDKKGIEIYEGDIVKHRGYSGMQASVVVFEAGAFIVGYHDGSSTKRRPMLLNDRVEVVGNIHDNPELMKL